MKLRTIIPLLAVTAFFSASAGGFLYYQSVRTSALKEAEKRVSDKAVHVERDITAYLADNQKAVKILAGLTESAGVLLEPDTISPASANSVLDYFRSTLNAGVCYLMDSNGKVVASSNRNEPDSFVGHNYAFRPYFKNAVNGNPFVYMAVGITSQTRGIYYSCPVYAGMNLPVVGVAVIKMPVVDLDRIFQRYDEGVTFLVSPLGIIFSSSEKKLLFQVFGEISPKKEETITQSRQFGEGPWKPAGFELLDAGRVRDKLGVRYFFQIRGVENFTGWKVIYLEPSDFIFEHLAGPVIRLVGGLILFFVLIICLGVFFLYRLAGSDIAEKKAYEDALKESEEKFRSIVEYSHEGIVIINEAFIITYANEEMCRLLGRDREEIVDGDFRDFLDESSVERVTENYRRRQRGEDVSPRYEFNLVRKNGEKRHVEVSASVIVDSTGRPMTVALVLDITDKKQAIEAIRESEAKYRTILESIQEGYFEVDPAGNMIFFNDSICLIMDWPREALYGKNFREYMKPEQARRIFQIYNKVFRTGRPAQLTDFEIITQDGSLKVVEGSSSLIRDREGTPIGFRGVIRDVTERVKAQKALKESEERYRTLLEGHPDPMIVYDMAGLVIFLNPAFTKVFGWELKEWVYRRMDHFVPEEEWPVTKHMIDKVLAGENFYNVETLRLTKWGERIPVSISGATYRDHDQNLIGSIINIRDIRQEKNLESQLRQAQKMEAVGTLASGVAHDFNNLLQAISGYVQLLERRHFRDETSVRYLREVDRTIDRASELIVRMLTFSRKMKPEFQPIDLTSVILHTVEILERTIPKMIDIETMLPDNLHAVFGDANQLEQVLMNLGINAKDAMPEGGRLTIEAENIHLSTETSETMIEINPGSYILLRVSDNGVGMDAETIEHIFEPFFTTKAVGHGTGLGLYSIYGIIKAHGGSVTCRSRTGEGTVFDIYLPALTENRRSAYIETLPEEEIPVGSETILLVDDEESIREIAQDSLEFHGYRTLQADNGESAVSHYRNHPQKIDLVILDLGMPGMGGQECLKELLKINPEAKVIIASGYSDESQIKTALKSGACDYIRKPYRLEDLLKKVRQTIDNKI